MELDVPEDDLEPLTEGVTVVEGVVVWLVLGFWLGVRVPVPLGVLVCEPLRVPDTVRVPVPVAVRLEVPLRVGVRLEVVT